MVKVKLGIYCAGNLGKELFDIAQRINNLSKQWTSIIFVDDIYTKKIFYSTEVHRLNEYDNQKLDIEFVIANGTPVNRKTIFDRLKQGGFELANLIDPTSIISASAKIGQGIIIAPFSTVSSDVTLADNTLIQSYVRVGHDIVVKKHSVLSSNTGIGGGTVVGEQTYIGMGAVIKEDVVIGDNVIIGMGSIVHTDIRDNAIAVGNPARIVKNNENGSIFGTRGVH